MEIPKGLIFYMDYRYDFPRDSREYVEDDPYDVPGGEG